MSFKSQICTNDRWNTLEQEGWRKQAQKSVYREGRVFTLVTARQNIDPCEITCRVSACSLLSIACLPFCILTAFKFCDKNEKDDFGTKACCQSNCYDPMNGHREQELFIHNREKSDEVYQKDCDKLGFDIHNSKGRKDLFHSRADNVVSHLSHHYLIYTTPVSKSTRYIFAPYGNIADIGGGSLSDPETGKSLSMEKAHKRMINVCRNYTDDYFASTKVPVSRLTKPIREMPEETLPLLSGAVTQVARAQARGDGYTEDYVLINQTLIP